MRAVSQTPEEAPDDGLGDSPSPGTLHTWGGALIALWGIGGIVALCTSAIVRLTPLALEPILADTLTSWQIALYASWVLVSAYSEGYRGFQKGFAPRVSRRALHLARTRPPLGVILAPAYCMGLFCAPRRRVIISWTLVVGITTLVILVRMLPQPWRGIVDGGVIVGLGWGVIATVAIFVAGFVRGRVPGEEPSPPT